MSNSDCVVCDFKGPLAMIHDMSAYMTGYACPKCGVMQVCVKETKKPKQTFWKLIKSLIVDWKWG